MVALMSYNLLIKENKFTIGFKKYFRLVNF